MSFQQTSAAHIADESDSLIELLVAQCADLEILLSLAGEETAAARRNDFVEVIRVVSERATIGERLESYHRQIAELRGRLGHSAEQDFQSETARCAVRLILDIQKQDARTRPLLLAARSEAAQGLHRLEQTSRSAAAYLREPPHAPIACDRLA